MELTEEEKKYIKMKCPDDYEKRIKELEELKEASFKFANFHNLFKD